MVTITESAKKNNYPQIYFISFGISLFFSIYGTIVLNDSTELKKENIWINVLVFVIFAFANAFSSIIKFIIILIDDQVELNNKGEATLQIALLIWSFVTYYSEIYPDNIKDNNEDLYNFLQIIIIYYYSVFGLIGLIFFGGCCFCCVTAVSTNNEDNINI